MRQTWQKRKNYLYIIRRARKIEDKKCIYIYMQLHTPTHTHTYIYMSIININYLLNCNIQIVQDTVIILSLPPSKRKKKSGSNIEQWA
jgi:hypothetical protein